jgi:ABC-2 type transport system permease protein
MLARILKHEWKNLIADRTLWVMTALFAVITLYGMYNGARWVAFQRQSLDAALKEEAGRLREHKEFVESGQEPPTPWRDPRSPYTVGGSMGRRYAFLPPAPLASLSIGQSDLYPYYFQVSTASKQSFLNNYELENPENLLAGRFDLAFAVVYLIPLLILALSHNVLSAEKEQGTLTMVLSHPVSLRTLVLGKVALRAFLVLVLALGFATAAFLLSGSGEGASPGAIALWMGVVASYCLFWFALSVLVNAFGKSSAANAMILAAVWLVLVVIVPAGVNLFVTTAHPIPSRVELVQAIREATNEANARAAQVMSRYFFDHPEMVPKGEAPDPNDYQARSFAIREEVERAMVPVLAKYDDRLVEQQAQVDRLRYLSPAIVTQEALNDIAGTGLGRYQHFLALVDRFHQEWRDFFVPRVFAKGTLTAADYDRFPKFAFEEEPEAAVRGRVTSGLLGLLAPLGIGLVFGVIGLKRYSVAGP